MTVGVSVAGKVMESVSGTGLGVTVAVTAVDVMAMVAVVVPLVGLTETFNEEVKVLEGRGLLVVFAGRLAVGREAGSRLG